MPRKKYAETRTYQDRKEYLKKFVTEHRRKTKRLALEYKGDKCQSCGYDKCKEALHFHHINPEEKSFGIAAKGHSRSWKKVKAELDKCILVCGNCHAEIHAGIKNAADIFQDRQIGKPADC